MRAGFVGISGYQSALNAFLIIIHTYAGPLLVFSRLSCDRQKSRKPIAAVLLLCNMSVITVLFAVVFFMRFHLFIWSVFAPKLLIECSHLLFVTLISILFVK